MSKVLITGINGFLGQHIAKKFKSDHDIFGLARNQAKVQVDIGEPFSDQFPIDNPIIIHAAALMPRGNSNQALVDSNIQGTKNILDWAVKNKAKKFIFISSGGIYRAKNDFFHKENGAIDPIGVYAYTKYIGENLVKTYHEAYGLPITIFRLFYPYGENQKNGIIPLVSNMLSKNESISISLNERPNINPIHIDDVINAISLSMDSGFAFETYNLCGDEIISFAQIVRVLEKKLNLKAKLKKSNEPRYDLMGDNSLLKEKLNWKPIRSFNI